MNILPLVLLAARNNPLIVWTGISFDTYNLVHRWLGRIVVLEALIHAIAWFIKKVKFQGEDYSMYKQCTYLTRCRRMGFCKRFN